METTPMVVFITVICCFSTLSTSVLAGEATCPMQPSSLDGAILHVGGSGPGNFTIVQDAIDNATANDTIFIYSASSPYNQIFNVTKPLHIIGEDKDTTIFLGRNFTMADEYVIKVQAPFVTIAELTIENSRTGINPNQHGRFTNLLFSDVMLPLYLSGSSNNTIDDNLFVNQKTSSENDGIYMYHANDNLIANNTMHFNGDHVVVGIHLAYGFRNTISDNTLFNCSIDAWQNDYTRNTFVGNTINGKTFVCLVNVSDTTVVDAAQVVLANCHHVTVTNITFMKQQLGVFIANSHACAVTGCTFDQNYQAILVASSDNTTLFFNTIRNILPSRGLNGYSVGICLSGDTDTSVSRNSIVNNSVGLYLEYCNGTMVSHNRFRNNQGFLKMMYIDSAGGVFVREGSRNSVMANNFIGNRPQASFVSGTTSWLNNYWGRPKIHPRPILGMKYTGLWILPHFTIQYDRRPALFPNSA